MRDLAAMSSTSSICRTAVTAESAAKAWRGVVYEHKHTRFTFAVRASQSGFVEMYSILHAVMAAYVLHTFDKGASEPTRLMQGKFTDNGCNTHPMVIQQQ